MILAYASLADVVGIYGNDYVLLAVDRDADREADADALTPAFEQASSLIDSYLAARYALPLSETPTVLVACCVDIAVYRWSVDHQSLTDEKRTRYEDALKWLRDVAKGLADLVLPTSGSEATSSDLVEYSTNVRQFTRTKLGGL